MRLSPAEDADLAEHIAQRTELDALARVQDRERWRETQWRKDRAACVVLGDKLEFAEIRAFWLEQMLAVAESLIVEARFERDQAWRAIEALRLPCP